MTVWISYLFLRCFSIKKFGSRYLAFLCSIWLQSSYSLASLKPYTNATLLGSGSSGLVFLEGLPAAVSNPAVPYIICREKLNEENTKKNEEVDEACPYKASIKLPFLYFSDFGISLFKKIKKQNELIDFVLKNKGKYISATVASDYGFYNDFIAFGFLQNESLNVNIAIDDENFIETVRGNSLRSFSFFSSLRSPLTSQLDFGASLKLYMLGSKKQNATLTDIAAVKDLKNLILFKMGSGIGLDVSLQYHSEDYKYNLGLIIQNVSNTKFSDGLFAKNTLSILYENWILASGFSFNINEVIFKNSFDFHDMFQKEETNILKNIHIGTSAYWDIIVAQVGLNQGNLVSGLGLKTKHYEIIAGFTKEEMGKKIGQATDLRYYVDSTFVF